MLNACGVATPTNPLPPCIMAPRGVAPAEVLRRAVEAARQTFHKPAQIVLVVLPDTGGCRGRAGVAAPAAGRSVQQQGLTSGQGSRAKRGKEAADCQPLPAGPAGQPARPRSAARFEAWHLYLHLYRMQASSCTAM